jgi:hypothetical protein
MNLQEGVLRETWRPRGSESPFATRSGNDIRWRRSTFVDDATGVQLAITLFKYTLESNDSLRVLFYQQNNLSFDISRNPRTPQ